MAKKIVYRRGRPQKNSIKEFTRVISFRMKQSVIEALEQLTEIYNEHIGQNISRSEMLEILIKNDMRQ